MPINIKETGFFALIKRNNPVFSSKTRFLNRGQLIWFFGLCDRGALEEDRALKNYSPIGSR